MAAKSLYTTFNLYSFRHRCTQVKNTEGSLASSRSWDCWAHSALVTGLEVWLNGFKWSSNDPWKPIRNSQISSRDGSLPMRRGRPATQGVKCWPVAIALSLAHGGSQVIWHIFTRHPTQHTTHHDHHQVPPPPPPLLAGQHCSALQVAQTPNFLSVISAACPFYKSRWALTLVETDSFLRSLAWPSLLKCFRKQLDCAKLDSLTRPHCLRSLSAWRNINEAGSTNTLPPGACTLGLNCVNK